MIKCRKREILMKNHTKLYEKIISAENIFAAIYSLESYIFEKNLFNCSTPAQNVILQTQKRPISSPSAPINAILYIKK